MAPLGHGFLNLGSEVQVLSGTPFTKTDVEPARERTMAADFSLKERRYERCVRPGGERRDGAGGDPASTADLRASQPRDPIRPPGPRAPPRRQSARPQSA